MRREPAAHPRAAAQVAVGERMTHADSNPLQEAGCLLRMVGTDQLLGLFPYDWVPERVIEALEKRFPELDGRLEGYHEGEVSTEYRGYLYEDPGLIFWNVHKDVWLWCDAQGKLFYPDWSEVAP